MNIYGEKLSVSLLSHQGVEHRVQLPPSLDNCSRKLLAISFMCRIVLPAMEGKGITKEEDCEIFF